MAGYHKPEIETENSLFLYPVYLKRSHVMRAGVM